MKGSLLFRKVCKDSAASLIVTVSVETVLYDISIGMKTSSDTGQTGVFVLDLGRGSYTIRSKDKVNATFKLSLEWYSFILPLKKLEFLTL